MPEERELWIPGTDKGPAVFVPRHKPHEKIVEFVRNGKKVRARIQVDDSGTVAHRETDETLDAVVRPRSLTIKIRAEQ